MFVVIYAGQVWGRGPTEAAALHEAEERLDRAGIECDLEALRAVREDV